MERKTEKIIKSGNRKVSKKRRHEAVPTKQEKKISRKNKEIKPKSARGRRKTSSEIRAEMLRELENSKLNNK